MAEIETLYKTPWMTLQRIGHWDFVRRPHSNFAVGVLAVTDSQEIVLVEQFRIPTQSDVIELPAGIVGDEPEFANESLAETAARELREETGYTAAKITLLFASPTSAGLTSEIIHVYLATGLTAGPAAPAAGEDIILHKIPLSQVRQWLAQQAAAGKLIDSKIAAALWCAYKT